MEKNKTNPVQHLNGIKCDVNNCVYNADSCHCTAKEIHVGPQFASCSSDTVCATFKPE